MGRLGTCYPWRNSSWGSSPRGPRDSPPANPGSSTKSEVESVHRERVGSVSPVRRCLPDTLAVGEPLVPGRVLRTPEALTGPTGGPGTPRLTAVACPRVHPPGSVGMGHHSPTPTRKSRRPPPPPHRHLLPLPPMSTHGSTPPSVASSVYREDHPFLGPW